MIINADILEWAETYQGEPFMAVMCDPPYGLNESEVDIHAVLADWMVDREHQPKGAGFMGREWDSFIPGPAIWRAIRRHCYPGAFLFAFGGTRTADLLGLALRLAGWEKRDEIEWAYGAGFPKNHHIGRAIDRAAKAERPIVGTRKHQPKFDAKGFDYRKKDNGYNSKERAAFNVTAPASDLSHAWDGHGTALKPAHEPILVFRNPFPGTYAENCVRTGAGALNIAGGRVGTADDMNPRDFDDSRRIAPKFNGMYNGGAEGQYRNAQGIAPDGRWPANLILQHAPGCQPNGTRRVRGTKGEADYTQTGVQGPVSIVLNVKTGRHYANADGMETIALWSCVESCPVYRLGLQSGERPTGDWSGHRNTPKTAGVYGEFESYDERPRTGDSGTAARFFFQADYLLERLEETDPLFYCAKSSRGEREAGLDPRQITLMGRDDIEETLNGSKDYETILIHFAGRENEQWVFAGQPVKLLVDTATSRPKVIAASMIHDLDAHAWNMMLFGSGKKEPSHLATKSITVTGIKSITESKTLNWLMRSLTNAYTADVSCGTENGGSLVENVGASNPWISFINDEAIHAPGVATVVSETLWIISANDAEIFTQTTVDDGRLTPIDNPYLRGMTRRRNLHPTLKPLSLVRHLATLLLPPAMYAPRRLLTPFSGAGSEYIGALLAGWEEIVGVELEADYCRIAEARIAYWRQMKYKVTEASSSINVKADAVVQDGQLDMFMEDV